MVLGNVVCGVGWLLGAAAPASAWGIAMFAAMLMLFGVGAVLIFINFLALRQAVTPTPLLGRMTSTMRWLIMVPAVPGALLGGWLGEHVGLRSAMVFAGGAVLLFSLLAWRQRLIRDMRTLPQLDSDIGSPAWAPGAQRLAASESGVR
jgi:MFS family permease